MPLATTPREGDESPNDRQRNKHYQQMRKHQTGNDQAERDKAPQNENPNPCEDEQQEDRRAKECDPGNDQARQADGPFEWPAQLLTIDDDSGGAALKKEPPHDDRQHQHCKEDGYFLGHV